MEALRGKFRVQWNGCLLSSSKTVGRKEGIALAHRTTRLLTLLLLLLILPVMGQSGPNGRADKVVAIINKIRKDNNLPPLKVVRELRLSAERYSDYMGSKDFFGHKGPDGSDSVSRNEKAGYSNWSVIAENIAAGYETPEKVVQAWMRSGSHRANILSKELQEIGVGYAHAKDSTYEHYWVQEFGSRQPRFQHIKSKGKTKRAGTSGRT